MPFGENAEFWLAVGLNADLDEAMKQAVRESIQFLDGELGMPRGGRLRLPQRGDGLRGLAGRGPDKGVHARIAEEHFRGG